MIIQLFNFLQFKHVRKGNLLELKNFGFPEEAVQEENPAPEEEKPGKSRDYIMYTECPKMYRKSVLHLLKYRFAVYN